MYRRDFVEFVRRAYMREINWIRYVDAAFVVIFLASLLASFIYIDGLTVEYEDRILGSILAILLAAVCVTGLICRWGWTVPSIILAYFLTPLVYPGLYHLEIHNPNLAEAQLRTVISSTIAATFAAICSIAFWAFTRRITALRHVQHDRQKTLVE